MVKRALLIGCNYPGTKVALKGCVNDVRNVKRMLMENFSFPQNHIKVLIDVGNGPKPTGANIKKHLNQLCAASKSGDVLFIHFSGHGTQVKDKDGDDEDNKDEAIVPTDLNLITDDDLRNILGKLPPNVHLTVVTDCCHSGSMLDHPEQQISGDKAQGSTVAADDDVEQVFGVNAGEGAANRAMPQTDFLSMFAEKFPGINAQEGLHRALHSKFGTDASAKSLKALGMLEELAKKLASSSKGGITTRAAGFMGGLFGKAGNSFGSAMAQAQAILEKPAPGENPAPGSGGEGDGALITGCQAHETSADACPNNDPSKAYGAMTNALTSVVRKHKSQAPNEPIPYRTLVTEVRAMLLKGKFSQNPCLECADDTVDKAFVC